VNSSVDVTLYSGYGAVDVYRQWRESGHIVGWILPWKANSLSVSPFNHSCIAVRASEPNCTYDISLIITRLYLHFLAVFCVQVSSCVQCFDADDLASESATNL